MIYIGFGMDLGLLLLLISLVAFILDIMFVIFGEYLAKWEDYSELSISIGSIALIISFLYFSYSILSGDYSFSYVSSYVNNQMDILLRISAIWSGQAGSYFFWVFLVVVVNLVFRGLFRNHAHETIIWRSFVLMTFQLIVLTILTVVSDPFKINTIIMSDGIGLNPLLMNIWNMIHPPVIFVGYVLCLIPMVIGIARISVLKNGKVTEFNGKEKLDKFFDFMVSLAWLVYSSGVIIGAYWAYVTLGWGGFWAWDPVETASLIPWLFLTLYYHGKSLYRNNEFLGNYIISMSYIGVLFATYLTRSAIISSVHAFQPEGTLEKILTSFIPEDSFIISIILRFVPNERILLLFIFLIVTFSIPHILGIKSRELIRIPFTLQKTDFTQKKSRNTALKISFISFFIGTYILILGLISPVLIDITGYIVTFNSDGFGSTFAVEPIFFNTILTLFGGIMLLAQFFCTFYPRLNIKGKLGLLAGGVAAGIIFSVSGFYYRSGILTSILGQKNLFVSIFGNFWTTSDKANLVMPLILLGIIGLLIEFVNVALKEEKQFIRKTSQIMLHLSLLIIILGAVTSANMTITRDLRFLEENREYEIPGTSLRIRIIDLKQRNPESGLYAIEYDTAFVLFSGSRDIGLGVSRLSLDQFERKNQHVTIISSLFTDIYIVTIATYMNVLTGGFVASDLQIKIIPYINILWIGCLFLHFAIIPLTIGRFILLRGVFLVSTEQEMEESHTEKDSSQEAIPEKVVN
jgi:cytochrome c biogenesis factor